MKTKVETNFFCKSKHWPRRMIKIKKIVKNILLFNNLDFRKKNFYFLNLIFVDDKTIKNINKKYRKANKSTDVLTFVNFLKKNNTNNELYCDIFFAAETIKNDAKTNMINFYDHLSHLIVHCFLHVNGYDHKSNYEFKKMKNLEVKILKNLEVKDPYLL